MERQCEFLGIPRSSYYYRPRKPRGPGRDEEAAMARIDELHVDFPCYGARKLSRALQNEGFAWCSRRVAAGLMRRMGVRAVYPGPKTSGPSKAGKFPYLLAGKPVTHPNQARRTINGEFGSGDARKKALGANCAAVQARVNEMLGCGNSNGGGVDIDALACAAIEGDYGNGDERKQRLGANYAAVQKRVNEMLS